MFRGLYAGKYSRFSKLLRRLYGTSSALDKSFHSTNVGSNLSYDHGASETPMLYQTVGGLLTSVTQKSPDNLAVISCHQNIEKTYEQLHHDVTRFAAGLLALGLQRGDNVAILSPNHYEWIVTQFATATAGLVLTTLNPAFMESEIKYALNKAECKAIVMADGFKDKSYFDMLSNIIPGLPTQKRGEISCNELPKLMTIITFNSQPEESTYSMEDIINCGEEKPARLRLESQAKISQPDDVANIQLTSGTTGAPKAVRLSHHMLVNTAFFFGRRIEYSSKNDIICLPVPLFHCFGCVLGTMASTCFGLPIVLPSPGYSAKATLKAIEDKKCTMVYGSPTMFIDMLNAEDFEKFNFNSLRGGVVAASYCSEETARAISTKMNMKDFCPGYGTTENSPVITAVYPEDPFHIRCSSVGRAIDHVEVKITDSDGLTIKRGETGELCSRGYQVMHGYLNEPEETKKVLGEDRWYKTGDLATMDDNGYVQIVGRIKDMIIRGGENIYPREVEEFLHTHPDIAEVEVFGIPDQRLGEIVCSWIKMKSHGSLTSTQVQEFCKDRIANYKIPEKILFVNEFPMTQSGKVPKSKLKELMIKKMAS